MRKSTGFPMLIVSLSSPKKTYDSLFLANYANINIIDALYACPASATCSSSARRLRDAHLGQAGRARQARPDGAGPVQALQQQSTVNPAGQIGASPAPPGQEMTYTVRAQGRLQTAEEFGEIVVRSNPDGSVVRLKDVARIELGALNYQQIGRAQRPAELRIVAIFQTPGSNALAVADGRQEDDGRAGAAVSGRPRLSPTRSTRRCRSPRASGKS